MTILADQDSLDKLAQLNLQAAKQMNGAAVTRMRASFDLTRAQLADLLDVKRVTVWRWENEPDKHIGRVNALALLQLQSMMR